MSAIHEALRQPINKAIKSAWFGDVRIARERYESGECRIPWLNNIFACSDQSVPVDMLFAPNPMQSPWSAVYLLEVTPRNGLPKKTGVIEAVACKSYQVTWRDITEKDIARVRRTLYAPPNETIGWSCYTAVRINVPERPSCWRVGKQSVSLMEKREDGLDAERAMAKLEKAIDAVGRRARRWIPARALVGEMLAGGETWAVALIRSKAYSVVALEKEREPLALAVLDEMWQEEREAIARALHSPERESMAEALRILAQADVRQKIRRLLSW